MNEVESRPFAGRFFVYAENWVPHEKVASSGLDRALVPIIAALQPWSPSVLLAPRSAKQLRHPLHPEVAPYAGRPSLLNVVLDEWRARREANYDGKARSLAAYAKSIGQADGVLLSVLGGDGRAYVRAAQLALQTGLQHVVYSVDDPFAWADERTEHRPKLGSLKPAVQKALAGADAVLTITAELATTLAEKVGRKCRPLVLPYIEGTAPAKEVKRQVIYIGNMSHLYGDSFVQIVEAVGRRRDVGDDLRLRATFTADALEGLLLEVPAFVDLGRIQDRKAFTKEIAESVAAVCPISFRPDQEMVRTSFPSKLLDYLAHARCIIAHGPGDSVAARYLVDAGLPYVTSSSDELDAVLRSVSEQQPDWRADYRAQLDAVHGGSRFRETLGAAIARIATP